MITFQGAAYLKAQMDSILGQSIPVHEIIVCDDGSTDGTREILAAYKASYPQIQLYFNEKNLGTVANMQQCLRMMTGDIIFLADQDDVWLPNKVEKTITFFQENPSADAVFSNADIINEVGAPHTDLIAGPDLSCDYIHIYEKLSIYFLYFK